MSDTVKRVYTRVLYSLGLDGLPIRDYDLLDKASLITELEKTFDIVIEDKKANEFFKKCSHKVFIEYIRTLV